jgi:hypothetical protein
MPRGCFLGNIAAKLAARRLAHPSNTIDYIETISGPGWSLEGRLSGFLSARLTLRRFAVFALVAFLFIFFALRARSEADCQTRQTSRTRKCRGHEQPGQPKCLPSSEDAAPQLAIQLLRFLVRLVSL